MVRPREVLGRTGAVSRLSLGPRPGYTTAVALVPILGYMPWGGLAWDDGCPVYSVGLHLTTDCLG